MKFKDKVILVTGGSRGIGRGLCLGYAKEGATVVMCYIGDEDKIEEIVNSCEELGGKCFPFEANVSKSEEVEKLFAYIKDNFGKLDVLVNNAGITRDNLMIAMSDQEFDSVVTTNLYGSYYCMKNAAKLMVRKRSGRIINISSIVGVNGNAGQVNYSASKAGVIGMTKSAAKELGTRNITVNAIAPGFIDTDMTRALNEDQINACLREIPMKKLGQIDDIVAMALFLSGEEAGYVTGQVLLVDGGMSL